MSIDSKKASELSGLLEQSLELFFGESTDTQARVYARLSDYPAGNWSLSGTIAGPTSQHAQTLSSTHRFVPLSGGPPLLAEAVVLDPCFWTPAAPHCYTVQIELRERGEVVAQTERLFGIRPFGAAGQHLFLDNKRWVLRAVDIRSVDSADLSDWRTCEAAIVASAPSESLCLDASRLGVLIVAEIAASDDLNKELKRLARWPAVGLAILGDAYPQNSNLKRVSPNLSLVHPLQRTAEDFPAPWSSAVIVPAERPKLLTMGAGFNKPVLVRQSVSIQASVADGRALCDVLQRETAALGNFAGYVIGAG